MFEVNRGAALSWQPKQARIKWPFASLNVGDEVVIRDGGMIGRAQVYAHVYARQAGMKFETKTVGGALHVVRIA